MSNPTKFGGGCSYLHNDCLDPSEPRKPCRCAEVLADAERLLGIRTASDQTTRTQEGPTPMSDDEGVDPGTPEFEAAALEGWAGNLAVPLAERLQAAMQVITILLSIPEIDRHARAYGFEVGRGTGLVPMLTASDDNPFLDPNWQEVVGPATLVWHAGPRSWSLPAEPGAEVTAVRRWPGAAPFRRTPGGRWQATGTSSFSWAELLAFGPLTDATGDDHD